MQNSHIGRLYADVNDRCIACGACLKVCPSRTVESIIGDVSEKTILGEIKSIFIGRSTQKDLFENGQSGGAATALLTYLFDTGKIDGALVVRMQSAIMPYGEAFIAHSVDELRQSQKSCYTPVALLEALKESSKHQSLAVVGLPCHIKGIVSLMCNHKRFSNIRYKIGLICDRTLCSGIQDALTPKSLQGTSRKIIFRSYGDVGDRRIPYREAAVAIFPENGPVVFASREDRFALKEMFTSPRCRICPDKLSTTSDVTLGDPWGMVGGDTEQGDNVIVIRTETGENWLQDAVEKGYILLKKASSAEELSRGQHIPDRVQQVRRYAEAMKGVPGEESDRLQRFRTLDNAPKETILAEANKEIRKRRIRNIIKNLRKKFLGK